MCSFDIKNMYTNIPLDEYTKYDAQRLAVEQWLRHYATSRKINGSRPDEVN
jgi:hypothetical protein